MLPGKKGTLRVGIFDAESTVHPFIEEAFKRGIKMFLPQWDLNILKFTSSEEGKIPPSQSGFTDWYNSVDLAEFDAVWADESLRGYIEVQIRYPKTYHEWLMVARADTFKYWGVTMEDIKLNRGLISQTSFINPTGHHGIVTPVGIIVNH